MTLDFQALSDLGWGPQFAAAFADKDGVPVRVAAVHRSEMEVMDGRSTRRLPLPRDWGAGDVVIGDWVIVDEGHARSVLPRKSVISRRAAGEEAKEQLIAANLDTLFIVSSCNADFNEARLERYLALARQGDVTPLVILTKADLADDASVFRARAEALLPGLWVETLDARSAEAATQLGPWCKRGQSVAVVGSSGVGKSTLINTLTGQTLATAGIREDDAKGRHTTTARSMHAMPSGAWLIDTPGMRALRLMDAGAGIDAVFADIVELASACRFSDCAHETEPACAVQAAITAGELERKRLERWRKLQREDARNTETVHEARTRDRAFGRMIREINAVKARRGDP